MSRLFTVVQPETGECGGWMCSGRKSRTEAIAEARRVLNVELDRLSAMLALPDDQMRVTVVRGSEAMRLVEELKP